MADDSRSADDMARTTASSDSVYNPTGAPFHAAEGGLLYAKYTQGAEQKGDVKLADSFRQVQQDAQRVQQAEPLLQ